MSTITLDQIKKWEKSGELEVLQIHFAAGGSSVLYALVYPKGALSEWNTPSGRAKWTQQFEEEFQDTRLFIQSLPHLNDGKSWRLADGTIEGLTGEKGWHKKVLATKGSLAVRVAMMDRLDQLVGSPSIRCRPPSLMMFANLYQLLEEKHTTLPDSGGTLRGCSVAEAYLRAHALKESRELKAQIPEVKQLQGASSHKRAI